jgi:hypothetical protein
MLTLQHSFVTRQDVGDRLVTDREGAHQQRHGYTPAFAGFRRFRGQDRASDRLEQPQIASASATGDRSSRLTAAER